MLADKSASMWFCYPAVFAFLLSSADILFFYLCFEESLPTVRIVECKIWTATDYIFNCTGKAFETSDQLCSASHGPYQHQCLIQVTKIIHSFSYNFQFLRLAFSFTAVKNLKKEELYCLRRLGLIYFLYLFIYSGLEFTVTFLVYHKLGYTSIDQAKIFVTTGIVMAILQGLVVRRLPSNYIQPSAVFGLYLIVPAFILVGLAKSGTLLYAGMILFAICKLLTFIPRVQILKFFCRSKFTATAFVVTCITTLISDYGNHDQKGTVLGIFRSLGALARAFGPIVASIGNSLLNVDNFRYRCTDKILFIAAFWGIGSTLTYMAGGLLLVIPALQLQHLKLSKLE